MEFTAGFRLDGGGTFVAPNPPAPPSLYHWGNTFNGAYSSPTQLGSAISWSQIAGPQLGLTTDGKLYGWGDYGISGARPRLPPRHHRK